IDITGQLTQVMREYLPEPVNRTAQDQFVSRLVALLSPPSGEKRVIRQIHPDGMVVFFFVVSIVILYKAFFSQPESLPLIVILLAAGFTAYVIFRKSLVSRYNMRKWQGQQEVIKIEKAVSRWMRTYYCARDQSVFDPITGHQASLEQLKDFFNED
ncbi:MAG: hypothetical protein IH586_15690, partial [Anaerolineaceae bacterium]|nr:hypothetical protein [Anaerolineaceae bacterium]